MTSLPIATSRFQYLFKDSSIVIEVNGEIFNLFPLKRSIRQGCHIALTLFVIVVGILFFILRASKLGPLVKGISLPSKEELKNVQFANVITLFLDLSDVNFNNVMNRLNFNYLASRAIVSP